MPEESPGRSSRGPLVAVVAAVAVVVIGWIVVLPPSVGSDEPGHVVRSAALVRGQLEDEGYLDVIFSGSYELPAWVGWPEPECWAFKLDVPVSCSTLLDEPTGTELRGTRAADYPIWGHVLPGLPTLIVDSAIGNRLARVAHAIVPFALLVASLAVAARRGRYATASLLVAITPVAIFNTATVNPSGLVIAGGIGLWTVLVTAPPGAPPDPWTPGQPDALVRWLGAASWAAMVLPRRDGLVYACLILAVVLGLGVRTPGDLRRLVARPQAIVVVASGLATLVWAWFSDFSDSVLLFAVPLVPVAAWGLRSLLVRSRWSPRLVVAALGVGTIVASVLAVAFVQRRDPRLDTLKWRAIVAETGSDLFEAFGVLGWLDAPMPHSFAFLYVAALGAMAAVVALTRPSSLVPVAVVLVGSILLSWWLTASQVGGSAEYWQGRYYLPLIVGVPILLGRADGPIALDRDRLDGLARGLGVVAAVVSVVAIGAAMRRFAVGIDGTMAPWRWHTFGAAVSPLWPLVVIALGWVGLLWSLDRLVAVQETPRRADESDATDVEQTGVAP